MFWRVTSSPYLSNRPVSSAIQMGVKTTLGTPVAVVSLIFWPAAPLAAGLALALAAGLALALAGGLAAAELAAGALPGGAAPPPQAARARIAKGERNFRRNWIMLPIFASGMPREVRTRAAAARRPSSSTPRRGPAGLPPADR